MRTSTSQEKVAIKRIEWLSQSELDIVQRFRFSRMLESDTYFKPSRAMQDLQKIRDTIDEVSDIYMAELRGEIVGTFRTTYLRDVVREYGDSYMLESFKHLRLDRVLEYIDLSEVCFVGRLAVQPKTEYSTRVLVRLLGKALDDAISGGMRIALADCSPRLLPLYQWVASFYASGAEFFDPVLGQKLGLIGYLRDHEAYHERCPLKRIALKYSDDSLAKSLRLNMFGNDWHTLVNPEP